MTPEREREYREYAASEEPPEMQRENWFAATLRRHGRTAASELLAEVDRLREQLSTLREAAAAHHRDGNRETRLALHDALDGTAQTAEAHRRRVEAAVLRKARQLMIDTGAEDGPAFLLGYALGTEVPR